MRHDSRSQINGTTKTNGRRRYLKEERGRSTYIVVTVNTYLCKNILINFDNNYNKYIPAKIGKR